MEPPLSVYREPTSYASKSSRQNSVLSFFRIQFAPYFLPPPAQEAAIRMLATSGEIPITSQHLCRGFLHGNEGHIWHHRPSFQPARPYPASRQAAGAEVSQAKRGRTPTGYQRQISAVTSPNDLRIHKVFPASFVIVSAKI